MVTTADYLHSFVEPMAEPPRKVPVLRRRFAAAQLFSCAAMTLGGIAFLTHAARREHGQVVLKPDPRRYPTASQGGGPGFAVGLSG
jgi:hypothetical protein